MRRPGVRPLRLHYIIPFFHPVIGGIEARVLEFSRRLAARGHDVHVHAMAVDPAGKPLPREAEVDGVRIHRTPPRWHAGGYRMFYRPEVPPGGLMDVHGYPLLTGDWARMALRRKVRYVHTPMGAPFTPSTRWATVAMHGYDALLGLPSLRRARRVIVMTGNERAWLVRHGVPDQRIAEIPIGVADDAFRPADAAAGRARAGRDRYLLFVARLYHEKRPLDLVEALGLVAAEVPDLGAVLAGPDQGQAAEVRARARALGVADRVVLTGAVTEREKWDLYAGSEAFVLPSAFEAQGIVIGEAWAQRRAVVATRVGGVPYIVDHGRTGLLVPVGEPAALATAVRQLAADPSRRAMLGAAGRAEAERRFDWARLTDRLEALYEAVLAEP